MVARTVGRVGVGQVGDAQEQVAQAGGHVVRLGGEGLLLLAGGAAAGLELLGGGRVAVAAGLADLLRQVVDFGTQGVALGLDLPQATVRGRRLRQLVEQFR